ncbi:MAG: right-handed parallel beta-helix repeat-containing protein [Spirochaetales bacterium]
MKRATATTSATQRTAWAGSWGGKTTVVGLTLEACRIRNTLADGVNLCSGSSGCVVRDCHFRNTGDDSLAAWSPKAGGPPDNNNTLEGNFIQLPWLANGIAIYGGGTCKVVGNTIHDTVTTGSGILIAANFDAWPLQAEVTVQGNRLVRCGAHESDQGGPTGALRVLAFDSDLSAGRIRFLDNEVIAPLESAVSIHGPRIAGSLSFERLLVTGLTSGGPLLDVRPGAAGSVQFTNMASDLSVPGLWRNLAGADFVVTRP